MADYYPLLAKAVGALPQSDADKRRAIYERARAALIGQLRAVDPPIAQSDIDRESEALDDAVARLERELAAAAGAPSVGSTPSPAASPAAAPVPTAPSPAQQAASSSPPAASSSPLAAPSSPLAASSSSLAAPGPVEGPIPRLSTRGGEGLGLRPALPASEAEEGAAERPREALRPSAPRPPEPRGDKRRLWIVGAVSLALVLIVALTAIFWRDRPGNLATQKAQRPVQAPPSDKNALRADGASGDAAAPAPRPGEAASGETSAAAPLAVAQRAILVIEDPEAEARTRTYTGSVVWRLDAAPAGARSTLPQLRADVELPEVGGRLSVVMQKNEDVTLTASYTIELRFQLTGSGPLPGVQQLGMLQMRREEAGTGDSLAGIPIQVTPTIYLVGLAKGDFEKRNRDLLTTRGWIDLPMRLTNGRNAKITLEKGATGERVLLEAFAAWGDASQ